MSPLLKKGTPWLREIKGYYGLMLGVEKVLPLDPADAVSLGGCRNENLLTLCAVLLDQNLSLDLDRRSAVRTSS